MLHLAHRELQRLAVSADLDRLASDLASAYEDVIDRGAWFAPAREALDAFSGVVQRRVSGTVRLDLFKGACRAVGRRLAVGESRGSEMTTTHPHALRHR